MDTATGATDSATDSSLSPQADSKRQDLFRHLVQDFISKGAHKRLTLVVIGETGQGKSTLINSLMGEQLAQEGHGLDPGTNCLEHFQLNVNDVQVEIWDTPGFGSADQKEEEKTLQRMAHRITDIDLVLYCIRIDSTRWPKGSDKETIVKITELFTKKFWSHCLFVLTFANFSVEHLRPEDEQDDLASQFSRHCTMWEDRIREQLQKLVSLSEVELKNIRTVPAGSYTSRKKDENPWKLPDRDDWFISFWIACTSQMRNDSLQALLLLNRHRLTKREGMSDELWQRTVPCNRILREQLENERSGFFMYVTTGAELGAQVGTTLGALAGGLTVATRTAEGLHPDVALLRLGINAGAMVGVLAGGLVGGAAGVMVGTVAELSNYLSS